MYNVKLWCINSRQDIIKLWVIPPSALLKQPQSQVYMIKQCFLFTIVKSLTLWSLINFRASPGPNNKQNKLSPLYFLLPEETKITKAHVSCLTTLTKNRRKVLKTVLQLTPANYSQNYLQLSNLKLTSDSRSAVAGWDVQSEWKPTSSLLQLILCITTRHAANPYLALWGLPPITAEHLDTNTQLRLHTHTQSYVTTVVTTNFWELNKNSLSSL